MTALAETSGTTRETLGRLVAEGTAVLGSAGIDGARLDARLLAAHALNLPPETSILRPDAQVAPGGSDIFWAMVRRRADGEPVSRILKRREFWSLEFEIGPAVLDPRPDSEVLVGAVLERLGGRTRAMRILDLGTGSGCLLLALLSELTAAEGLGLDASPDAVTLARSNARRLGLDRRARFMVGDWAAALAPGGYDLVVSNPPYIPSATIATLAPEVADHDPRLALDGGADGLDCYRIILAEAPCLLAPSGMLALEFGEGQDEALQGLARAAGLAVEEIVSDLAGRPRCLLATPAGVKPRSPGKRSETVGVG